MPWGLTEAFISSCPCGSMDFCDCLGLGLRSLIGKSYNLQFSYIAVVEPIQVRFFADSRPETTREDDDFHRGISSALPLGFTESV